MKQKLDFVTNSSSASFIIGTKKDVSLKIPITIEVDLKEYLRFTLTTVEQLHKYWIVDCGNSEESQTYIKCKKVIESGDVVHFIRCGDEDGPIEAMLCEIGIEGDKIPKSINVIRGQGGY